MLASLKAEALKLRRLRLPLIAAAGGLIAAGLTGLTLWSAASRIATEERMETPWQNIVIGEVTATMMLVLPLLATLIAALAFLPEHRGEMDRQLRLLPKPMWKILAAKLIAVEALLLFALVVGAAAAIGGWHLLPEALRGALAAHAGEARGVIAATAFGLFVALLPASLIQFALSARLANILHPVAIGLALTIGSLMLYGPETARFLPYAWPGETIMARFAAGGLDEVQQPDPDFPPPPRALAGRRPGQGAIWFDAGHRNRHVPGSRDRPGSLAWMVRAAEEAGLASAVSNRPFTRGGLDGVDLLVIGAASRPFSRAEGEAIVDWVGGGGSLLLLTDHPPFAAAAEGIAARLGVRFSRTMVEGDEGEGSRRSFARVRDPLGGRHRQVRVYGGQAIWREDGEARRLLALEPPVRSVEGGTIAAPAPAALVLAFEHRRGRVVVAGDSGLFGAQLNEGGKVGVNDGETGNAGFAVGVLRWLLRMG